MMTSGKIVVQYQYNRNWDNLKGVLRAIQPGGIVGKARAI